MRITYNAALVLKALSKGHAYGFEIMDVTGLPSGTTYPILRRFERDGLVRSRWEESGSAHDEGRPARRLYELTPDGRDALDVAAARFEAHQAMFAPDGGR